MSTILTHTINIDIPKGYEIDEEKSTYKEVVFKKIDDFPKSWEDLKKIKGSWIDTDSGLLSNQTLNTSNPDHRNVFSTIEIAKAALAVAQLSQLRDRVRNGWEPDWKDTSEYKYIIYFERDEIRTWTNSCTSMFLSFETEAQRDKFLKYHIDLIEQARPILGG